MADERIRRQVAFVAAQMMYARLESEYFTAKRKAAAQLGLSPRDRLGDLPSNREIRDQIQAMARMHEGDRRDAKLREMRVEALRLMRRLARFRPRLIGSVLTGHVRKGSDIDIHLFSDSLSPVSAALEECGLDHEVERKRVVKHGEARTFTHIHLAERYPFELTLYPEEKVHYVFKSSITGQAIETASIAELETLLRAEDPEADLDEEIGRVEDQVDRFELYRLLLQPLDGVKQDPKYHPEGDVLYHSLQVFELARAERSYDEEFLLAALLHDVGKGIDPSVHVTAGLQALEGTITERTEFLITHHMDVMRMRRGTLGAREWSRVRGSEHYDDLMLLRALDVRGRQPGAEVCELDEALDVLRELDAEDAGS